MFTLPRGMAAGVLALLPAQQGLTGTERFPVVVFAAVLTTVVLFAVGFPILKRRAAAAAPEQTSGPISSKEPETPGVDIQVD